LTIVTILDEVTKWAKQNICNKIQLKVPPKGPAPNDDGYDYKTANPVAFTMYVPTEDKLPKNIPSAFPSLCVRFLKAQDDLAAMKGTMAIQLLLSAWNPGTHSRDRFTADTEDPFRWFEDQAARTVFERNSDGWRDIWNFTDIALQAIESVSHISGYVIDRSVPVEFGPLTEQDGAMDYYPFWFTWVSFQISYPLVRKLEDAQDFL
jgi:hypothetical protein